MITAFGTVQTAVEAMKSGAYDYITKPIDYEELVLVVNRALEHQHLLEEVRILRSGARPEVRLREHYRPLASLCGCWKWHRGWPQTRLHGADSRRDRDRQGTAGQRHPPEQPAQAAALRDDQLRRDSEGPARVRAVRPRAGVVHRGLAPKKRQGGDWPTAGRCSWTRSARCRWSFR